MKTIKEILKGRISGAIELLPYGRDFVLYLTRNRRGISYRGVFDTYEEAAWSVSKRKSNDYDIINAKKANNPEIEKQRLEKWFHDTDYPLLFWVSRLVTDKCTVLDLGGSLGHFFYSIQDKLALPQTMKYIIAELPSAIAFGEKIARERNETRLLFLDSNMLNSVQEVDVFMTAGTLQYMVRSLPQIIDELKNLPDHILIHNLPIHPDTGYFTIQNLELCDVPYRVYSKPFLCDEMNSRGYRLIEEWVNNRTIEIPFHRSVMVEGYGGFYFRKGE